MRKHTIEKKTQGPSVSNSAAPSPESGKSTEADHKADVKSTADLRAFAHTCFQELLVKWPKATIASPPKL